MNKHKWLGYLKDVWICSLGAYGGPEAHYGIFIEQLVIKEKHLTEEELMELIVLTSVLPGPSSTQTIIAIGYKLGGPILGLLTFIVWAFPIILLMILFVFIGAYLQSNNITLISFKYIAPMAVGFMIVAAYRLAKKVWINQWSVALLVLAAIVSYFIKSFWIYPSLLLIGGLVSIWVTKEKKIWNRISLKPVWTYFVLFLVIAVLSYILSFYTTNILLQLFDSFYRFGYMVIGGGQVVIPMMFNELVEISGYLSADAFLTGYGLVQGLPGPMFGFSAYVGALASEGSGTLMQIMTGLVSSIGIFLPGVLLIYFVYPLWEKLKEIKGIKISLKGIVAIAAGLVCASALTLLSNVDVSIINLMIILLTVLALLSKKIPAPLIVLLVILIGIMPI